MVLSKDDCQLIEIYSNAKQNNETNVLICICAYLLVLSGGLDSEGKSLLNGFSKGQYKRAIKCLRMFQSNALRENQPELAADYDSTVRYIRENCLSRVSEHCNGR